MNNFPVGRALEFDSRRMGALTFGDFLRFAQERNNVFSGREKKRMGADAFAQNAAKCFEFLDANKDGLLSLLDADELWEINDRARVESVYHHALGRGKPYSANGEYSQAIIMEAARHYMDEKLSTITGSRKAIGHQGAFIYSYRVPLLYLAPEQEGATILHVSDIHFNEQDDEGNRRKAGFLSTLKDKLTRAPDIVVITGDLITNRAEDLVDAAKGAFEGLFPDSVRAFVFGNHDLYFKAGAAIGKALEGMGYKNITNAQLVLKVGGKDFSLIGVDDHNEGSPKLPEMPYGTSLLPQVLATHNLDEVDASYPGCFDLVLTGHTHLGEKNYVLFDGYDYLKFKGAYKNVNRQKDEWGVASQRTLFHITSGLGSHTTRFNSTEEGVTLITLVQG